MPRKSKPTLTPDDFIAIADRKTNHLTDAQITWLFIALPLSLHADSVDMEQFLATAWAEDTVQIDHLDAIRTGFTHWLDFARR